jgi:hypothetical protein
MPPLPFRIDVQVAAALQGRRDLPDNGACINSEYHGKIDSKSASTIGKSFRHVTIGIE